MGTSRQLKVTRSCICGVDIDQFERVLQKPVEEVNEGCHGPIDEVLKLLQRSDESLLFGVEEE